MLFRQMEYFCAVVHTNSFTKAADECYVSQSAISQQIKALEAELDVELLHRTGRSFTLTPAGEHFHRVARDVLEQVDKLRFDIAGIAHGAPTSLSIGYLNRYDGWEVQGAVAAFAARHPHVSITAKSGSHDDLYDMVMSGQADLVFNDKRRAFSDEFVNRPLLTCCDYVVVSEGSPLAWREQASVADLRGLTCILVATPEKEDVERTYHRDVLNFDCDFLFAESTEEALMLVASNRGFMPLEARPNADVRTSAIRRIPLVNDTGPIEHEYYAFWQKSRENPLIVEFADVLEGLFARED